MKRKTKKSLVEIDQQLEEFRKDNCNHKPEDVLSHYAVVVCNDGATKEDPIGCGNEIAPPIQVGQECKNCGKKTCKCDFKSPRDRIKVVTHIEYGICEEHTEEG